MYNRLGGKEKDFFFKKRGINGQARPRVLGKVGPAVGVRHGAIQAFSCRDRLHDLSTGNRINETSIKCDLEDFHLVRSIRM